MRVSSESRPSSHYINAPRPEEEGEGEGGTRGRGRRDDLKGRKVISEVISEHERENGKQLECVYRVPVIDGSRFALSDGDYASGVVYSCVRARTQCIIIKRPGAS